MRTVQSNLTGNSPANLTENNLTKPNWEQSDQTWPRTVWSNLQQNSPTKPNWEQSRSNYCFDSIPGDFTFISRRHHGYPFSLSFYINGVFDCRLSTCCEYKHASGSRLGGPLGHFGVISIEGAAPCYKWAQNSWAGFLFRGCWSTLTGRRGCFCDY